MMPSSRSPLAAILANARPAGMTNRIRKIWPDLMLMRAELLTYRQIADILEEHYGIQIHHKHLATIVLRVSKNPPPSCSAGKTQDTPGPSFDPIAEAKRRREEKVKSIWNSNGGKGKWEGQQR
jgi:hypothetical protein